MKWIKLNVVGFSDFFAVVTGYWRVIHFVSIFFTGYALYKTYLKHVASDFIDDGL